MGVPHIDELVPSLFSEHTRVRKMAHAVLPTITRIAPARVAKHLPLLTEKATQVDASTEAVLSTFIALCSASSAYQRKLE